MFKNIKLYVFAYKKKKYNGIKRKGLYEVGLCKTIGIAAHGPIAYFLCTVTGTEILFPSFLSPSDNPQYCEPPMYRISVQNVLYTH
ncbi:hypothetical protein HME9304_00629 [Flagellimonas maritima]|uniref:Uncharacterized protein n=1 Tax=Flagellimonas maritima TaxID=1383885 RepID=A0A2Z4LQF4_9FLAO|nr:hypothetical protein HME9304_00629 [Allomuricauda aurantiaca]